MELQIEQNLELLRTYLSKYNPQENGFDQEKSDIIVALCQTLMDLLLKHKPALALFFDPKISEEIITEACYTGNLEIIKLFVEGDRPINDNWIISAASYGQLGVIKYLHGKGASLTSRDNKAIVAACWANNLETVKYLHENGSDITAWSNDTFIGACSFGNIDIIKYWYDNNKSKTLTSTLACGMMEACRTGRYDVVVYLHSIGVSVNSNDGEPIKAATAYGHQDIIDYLIKNGADPKDQNKAYDWLTNFSLSGR